MKDIIKKALREATEENNPWAICTASVGRENKDKYEACVKSVKKQYNMESAEINEEDISIDGDFSHTEFAIAVAEVLKNEYGSDKFDSFMEVLHKELGI